MKSLVILLQHIPQTSNCGIPCQCEILAHVESRTDGPLCMGSAKPSICQCWAGAVFLQEAPVLVQMCVLCCTQTILALAGADSLMQH